MVKIGICIETVFSDLPYEERIKRIAEIGFLSFEFWYHDRRFDGANLIKESKDIEAIAKIARDKRLQVSNFVVNSPEGQIGGSLVKPEDKPKYLARLKEVIPLAHKLNCKKLISCTGNEVKGRNYKDQRESITDTLSEASKIVEKENMVLLLEPLNTLVDHSGYFLDSADEGAKIIREINHPNIRLLFDIYHMQIMEGNILSTIEENIDIIGHFHAAGVPGRHELWMGELNYKNIIKKIDELGYEGYFGLEYFPEIDSEKSLQQTKEYLS
jgi:hydroxypyruvate isomerase